MCLLTEVVEVRRRHTSTCSLGRTESGRRDRHSGLAKVADGQFSERVACAQEGSCDEEGIDDGAHDAEDDGLVLKDVG